MNNFIFIFIWVGEVERNKSLLLLLQIIKQKGVHMARPLKNKKDQELLADQEKIKIPLLFLIIIIKNIYILTII